jgi:hypothetical protein
MPGIIEKHQQLPLAPFAARRDEVENVGGYVCWFFNFIGVLQTAFNFWNSDRIQVRKSSWLRLICVSVYYKKYFGFRLLMILIT